MRPVFSLGNRLSVCSNLVREKAKLADIGTDHAYLPIWLLKEGKIDSAIAADINEGPLEYAKQNAEKYGLSNKLTTRISDGLKEIDSNEVTDIVIAGMGGELILSIIKECDWIRDSRYNLILQPMSKPEELRLGLYGMGFEIEEEIPVEDSGKVYSVIRAEYTDEKIETDIYYELMGKIQSGTKEAKIYAEKVVLGLTKKAGGMILAGADPIAEKMMETAGKICDKYINSYEDN